LSDFDFLEQLEKDRQADFEKQLVSLPKTYTPFYSTELTANIEAEVSKSLKEKGMFKFIVSKNGDTGIGKTTSIYRIAKQKGWRVKEYNALTDLDSTAIKNELKTIVTSYNNPPVILLFDNIEEMELPDWFIPTKEEFEDKKRRKNKFLDIATQLSRKGNFMLFATGNEFWKASRVLDNYFIKIKIKPPNYWVLYRIAKARGLRLPKKFPNDIRQLHFFLKYNGLYTPYKKKGNPFNELREFLSEYPKTERKIDPPIEHWLMFNLFNNNYFLHKHKKEFYETIALLCLYDMYDEPKFLDALPPIAIRRDAPIFYPK